MVDIVSFVVEFIVSAIRDLGYLGIFLGMVVESSFFPFPSEVVLIPAGALVAKGEMSFFIVFLMSLLGSLAGALINYFLALFLGRKAVDLIIGKYGRLLFVSRKNLAKSDKYFENYGEITTFVGRLIPVVRQLISIPAGFARMKMSRFILFTSIGAGIWSFILIYVGFAFGSNSDWLARNKSLLTYAILLILLISVIAYIFVKKKRAK